ncbi:MAG: O-antigen ligase family protein [Pyrinomonadaceae bacterium]|nr:O-antigen ligase family protein [Pyrinomonadaceae bacterium]
MKNQKTIPDVNGAAAKLNQRPSITSGLVFALICFVPIFASVVFGAVSTGTLALLTIVVGLLLIFWTIDIWFAKKVRLNTSLILVPIICLIFIGLLQLLPLRGIAYSPELLTVQSSRSLSLDANATWLAMGKLFIFLLFFTAALTYVNSPQRLRKVVFTIIVFSAVMSFIGILQYLGSPNLIFGLREVDYATPFASYVNRHHFAAFMEMTIGLTLGLLFGKATENDKRLLLVIAVVLMGIAVIMTSSRGGFLSLIGVLGFLVFLNLYFRDTSAETDAVSETGGLRENLVLIGGSVGLVLVLLVVAIWLGGTDEVARGAAFQVNQEDFSSGRLHFWSVALQIFKDYPILGSGLESFGVAFTQYDSWNGALRVEQAHNDYLQTLSDSGIVGFICVVSFIFLLFKRGLNVVRNSTNRFRKNVAIGALAGCFGILLHSFVDFPLRTNANMLFFLLLAALATVNINYPKVYRKPVPVRN